MVGAAGAGRARDQACAHELALAVVHAATVVGNDRCRRRGTLPLVWARRRSACELGGAWAVVHAGFP
jgi:hypothetical protein